MQVVQPLVWMFNQVATSLSSTFVMVWKSLHLPLLFDPKTTADVRAQCMAGMGALLPHKSHDVCIKRTRVLVQRSVPGAELSAKHAYMLVVLAFTTRGSLTHEQQAELQWQYRYLRNLAICSHTLCRSLVEKLPTYASNVPPHDAGVQHELLDLAVVALFAHPKFCMGALIKGLAKPEGCTLLLQHLKGSARTPHEVRVEGVEGLRVEG